MLRVTWGCSLLKRGLQHQVKLRLVPLSNIHTFVLSCFQRFLFNASLVIHLQLLVELTSLLSPSPFSALTSVRHADSAARNAHYLHSSIAAWDDTPFRSVLCSYRVENSLKSKIQRIQHARNSSENRQPPYALSPFSLSPAKHHLN